MKAFQCPSSLVFLNQRPLSSAFVRQALLLRPIHSNLLGTYVDGKIAEIAGRATPLLKSLKLRICFIKGLAQTLYCKETRYRFR